VFIIAMYITDAMLQPEIRLRWTGQQCPRQIVVLSAHGARFGHYECIQYKNETVFETEHELIQ